MKSLLLLIITLLLFGYSSHAQTATNFVSKDCQGITHDFFAELDAGKVIVICWVMPCLPCVNSTLTSYKVVESYQANKPGQVLFYLTDDNGGTSCSELSAWANKYKIYETAFTARFSDPKISMLDYGSEGMPKFVVVGGSSHKVFYNVNDGVNANDLQNAINEALKVSAINENSIPNTEISIFPNPASESLKISIKSKKSSQLSFVFYDLTGRNISASFYERIIPGDNTITKDITGFKPGLYLLKICDSEAEGIFSRIITIN